jgi:hypothetical protein
MGGMEATEDMGLLGKLEEFLSRGNNMEEMNGGVIGTVRIVDVVKQHRSKWFKGPFGIVLADPKPIKFQPGPGQLGFFNWTPSK